MPFPTPLTPDAIQKLLQSVTLTALGLAANAYASVRVGWQPQGQPGWALAEDVVIVNAIEDDDQYNRVRESQTLPNDADSILLLVTYTRVWRGMWTFYGPNSFDRARILKSALLATGVVPPALTAHDVLALQNLYLVTDVSAPQRVPELYEKQWWERVDFSCQFNEQVQEATIVPSVASVEVIVENANGIVADITI